MAQATIGRGRSGFRHVELINMGFRDLSDLNPYSLRHTSRRHARKLKGAEKNGKRDEWGDTRGHSGRWQWIDCGRATTPAVLPKSWACTVSGRGGKQMEPTREPGVKRLLIRGVSYVCGEISQPGALLAEKVQEVDFFKGALLQSRVRRR